MSSPFTQAQLKTPKGFEHLLEGLCKEVLRRQPENILEYATEHFNRLMKLREETGYDGYTPKAEIELESQTATEEEGIPVVVEPEDDVIVEDAKGEEQGAEQGAVVGETQDDAPEAEQTPAAPEEARETEETVTEGDRPESDKAEPTSSLPEAEAPVDEVTAVSADNEATDTAGAGEGVSSDAIPDTDPDTDTRIEAQDKAEKEEIKDQSPEDSGEIPIDPAETEIPASDGDSD